ncbi:anhydro-N-acetylmuramic acid kinase [Flavobacterium suaedae]|uniref:Anhydro-N-acetylmuramic acid kinase n=2 Tax=Flavobacterium suaedae TaxID=1767027 RepID=A0ABQ1JW51_9FLAO|nr:anhydro-N-acetylmuramic acid kinase [Flavobacterium suaedae]
MSGTSLDGVDIAHVILNYNEGKWQYEINKATTIFYTDEWVDRLKNGVNLNQEELILLDDDYTILLSSLIKQFITENKIDNLDAVCSHGHTILHQPQNKLTLQIGNQPKLAKLTGQRVVCNFRVQDVEMGGQGAPLVPIGDRLLFQEYDFCLNLGGFSNISFEEARQRIAYDICPVNIVLNYYSSQVGLPYDEDGAIARKGKLIEEMLLQLNDLDFYKQQYPKSLGLEYVQREVFPVIDSFNAPIADKVNTFTIHAAMQIANEIKNVKEKGCLLVTGGGAYNTFLIEKIKQLLPDTEVIIPDDRTIQFKEALVFALLGVLRIGGEVNVLSSVTGGKRDHSAGYIYEP